MKAAEMSDRRRLAWRRDTTRPCGCSTDLEAETVREGRTHAPDFPISMVDGARTARSSSIPIICTLHPSPQRTLVLRSSACSARRSALRARPSAGDPCGWLELCFLGAPLRCRQDREISFFVLGMRACDWLEEAVRYIAECNG